MLVNFQLPVTPVQGSQHLWPPKVLVLMFTYPKMQVHIIKNNKLFLKSFWGENQLEFVCSRKSVSVRDRGHLWEEVTFEKKP